MEVDRPEQAGAEDQLPEVDVVAAATVGCFLRIVPAAVPGVAFFLAVNRASSLRPVECDECAIPLALAVGVDLRFARANQQPALEIRHGEEANVAKVQGLFPRASCSSVAIDGDYDTAAEGAWIATKRAQRRIAGITAQVR